MTAPEATSPVLKLLLRRFPLQLRLIFRHFPLVEVHAHALGAALAAEAAGARGKFWPMHDSHFDNQAHLKSNRVRRYAEHLEIDMSSYDAEAADTVPP